MTCSSKLQKLIEKYSLPDDATQKEVLRALDVHCAEHEVDRCDLYSSKCEEFADQEEFTSGYD